MINETLALDIDAVLADLQTEWLYRYNLDYKDNLKAEQILSWGMDEYVKPECGKRIYDYLLDDNLYTNVNPIPGALQAVNKMRDLFTRVIFCTMSPFPKMGRKFQWLIDNKFFEYYNYGDPEMDYIETRDKSLINADYLIDDYFVNLANFQRYGIIFTQPWNKDIDCIFRLDNWNDFLENGVQGIIKV